MPQDLAELRSSSPQVLDWEACCDSEELILQGRIASAAVAVEPVVEAVSLIYSWVMLEFCRSMECGAWYSYLG